MRIAVLAERREGEHRVALTPDAAKALIKAGAAVTVERGAGGAASYSDGAYESAGASLADRAAVLEACEALFCVARPDEETLSALPRGTLIVGLLEPHGDKAFAQDCARRGLDALVK